MPETTAEEELIAAPLCLEPLPATGVRCAQPSGHEGAHIGMMRRHRAYYTIQWQYIPESDLLKIARKM